MQNYTVKEQDSGKKICSLAESRLRRGICDIFYTGCGDICKIKKYAYYMLGALRYSSVISGREEEKGCNITAMFLTQASAAAYLAQEKGKTVFFEAPRYGIRASIYPRLLEYALLLMISSGLVRREYVNISMRLRKSTAELCCDAPPPDKYGMEYAVISRAAAAHGGRFVSCGGHEAKTIFSFPLRDADAGKGEYDMSSVAEVVSDKFSPAAVILSQI